MRGINHPSVVKLVSFSESQEHYFLVLERMSSYLSACHSTNGLSLFRSDGRWRTLPPDRQADLLQ